MAGCAQYTGPDVGAEAYTTRMAVLHVADSATHLGGASILGFVIAAVGIGVGAFFVFGMPAMLQRRGGGAIGSESADENAEAPEMTREEWSDGGRY